MDLEDDYWGLGRFKPKVCFVLAWNADDTILKHPDVVLVRRREVQRIQQDVRRAYSPILTELTPSAGRPCLPKTGNLAARLDTRFRDRGDDLVRGDARWMPWTRPFSKRIDWY